MKKWQITTLLLIGVVLLVISILLRVFTQGIYEIKTIDLVIVILPLLFAGLATGKVRGFDLLGIKVDFTDIWDQAIGTQIEGQIAKVSFSTVEDAVEMNITAEKGMVKIIPRLIEQRTEALAFRLGVPVYKWEAIKKYFDDLYGISYFKYVIINHPNKTLFGIYYAVDLIPYLSTLGEPGYQMFKDMLIQGENQAKDRLSQLPGFVSSEIAVITKASKRDALQSMEEHNLDCLPVVDTNGEFIGTVEREKLTTSLILTVTKNISSNQTGD